MAVSVPVPVGKQVADNLMDRMVPLVEKLPVGPPDDNKAAMGPIITKQSLERITSLLQSGVDQGAADRQPVRPFRIGAAYQTSLIDAIEEVSREQAEQAEKARLDAGTPELFDAPAPAPALEPTPQPEAAEEPAEEQPAAPETLVFEPGAAVSVAADVDPINAPEPQGEEAAEPLLFHRCGGNSHLRNRAGSGDRARRGRARARRRGGGEAAG